MKFFKASIVIVLLQLLGSCSLEGDKVSHSYQTLPIESIVLPAEFTLGEEYTIDFTYLQPTSCHGYYNIFIDAENENRTLAVTSIVFNDNNCEQLQGQVIQQSFDFKVLYNQTYIFHVWKGTDNLGEDVFEIIEVPTVN